MSRLRPLPLLSLVLVAVLAACNGEPVAQDNAAATPPAAAEPAPAQPAVQPSPAAPAAAPAAPAADNLQLARFDGYGDLRFGMTAAEAKQAWGGELKGVPGADAVCYYLSPVSSPTPADFAFMIENDTFVRYDVGNDKDVAPGGGRQGMSADEIRKRYPGRVEERAHKYVEGGKYLRISADDGSDGVLVFATDADGTVTSWRAGVAPQVDYVEGCS